MSLSGSTIVITGLGMASSLDGVVTACAAARAGMTRAREMAGPTILDEDAMALAPIRGHAHPTCTEGFRGRARLARLGAAALQDLREYAGLSAQELSQAAWFLSFQGRYLRDASNRRLETSPSSRPQASAAEVIPLLMRTSGLHVSERHLQVREDDHHGPIRSVQEAISLLQSRQVERCLIGGVDCFLDPEDMERLSGLRLLKSVARPIGFMPGEAAAFFILERYATARLRNARVEAALGSVAITREEPHRFSGPSLGVGLAEAAERVLTATAPHHPGLVIHNLNGDAWRAMEWGSALVRMPERHAMRDIPVWFPAGSLGETGAATAPIAVCMAVRAFVRSYARTPHVLVCMSSYDGNKGCLMLTDARSSH